MKDTDVNRFLELRHFPPSAEQISNFIEQMNISTDNLFLGIFLKSGLHIGNIKLGPVNVINKRAAIGLLIGNKDSWGKGFASEAIQIITSYAFENLSLHRVEAGCYSNNLGSCKAFIKNGFSEEARLKDYFISNKNWEDQILFAKFNS
jgi:[ribosomal protein S5]-alanine N-acetyltransferase